MREGQRESGGEGGERGRGGMVGVRADQCLSVYTV